MTLETQEATITPESQAPDVPAPETPEVSPTPEVTPEGEAAAAAIAAYKANPVYKVRSLSGQQVEKKIPDYLLPVIKDAKTEAEIREIFEKADGLDFVKNDRKSMKDRLSGYEQKFQQHYAPMEQTVQRIVQARDSGDFDAVFKLANIQPQQVLQWALKFAQSTPEQRTLVEQNVVKSIQSQDIETQAQQQQQYYQQQMADYRSRELDFTLQRPDLSQAIQAFDTQHGPGAFKNQVIERGKYHALQGQDISVEQAVNDTLKMYQPFIQTQQVPNGQQAIPPQGQSPATQDPSQVRETQAAKPVIPNIQGRGTSPAKVVPKSLADMRKLGKQMQAQD